MQTLLFDAGSPPNGPGRYWARLLLLALVQLLAFVPGLSADPVTRTWVSSGADQNWSTAGNWSPSGVPQPGDSVIFAQSNVACTIDVVSNNLAAFIVQANYTNTITFNYGAVNSPQSNVLTISGSFVMSNGTVIECLDFTVESNALVDARFEGFRANDQTGSGKGPAGYGAHGGDNGFHNGTNYGNPAAPTSLGDGGSYIYALGGGAIKITATNFITVDGSILADGYTNAFAAGRCASAGGSIWLIAPLLSGGASGLVSAVGGNGTGGSSAGGGGGRICLTVASNLFNGRVTADPGADASGAINAERGTVVYAPIGGTASTPGIIPVENVHRKIISFKIKNQDDPINWTVQSVIAATLADFQYSLDNTNWYAPSNGDASTSLVGFTNSMASSNSWTGPNDSFTFYTSHPDITNPIRADPYYVRFHIQAVVTQANNMSGANFTATGLWVTSQQIPTPSRGTMIGVQ